MSAHVQSRTVMSVPSEINHVNYIHLYHYIEIVMHVVL